MSLGGQDNIIVTLGKEFPGDLDGKASVYNAGNPGWDPWVGKIPWRRKWQSTPVLLPGKSHGQRSLVGYSPWGHKESDTTERLHVHIPEPNCLSLNPGCALFCYNLKHFTLPCSSLFSFVMRRAITTVSEAYYEEETGKALS